MQSACLQPSSPHAAARQALREDVASLPLATWKEAATVHLHPFHPGLRRGSAAAVLDAVEKDKLAHSNMLAGITNREQPVISGDDFALSPCATAVAYQYPHEHDHEGRTQHFLFIHDVADGFPCKVSRAVIQEGSHPPDQWRWSLAGDSIISTRYRAGQYVLAIFDALSSGCLQPVRSVDLASDLIWPALSSLGNCMALECIAPPHPQGLEIRSAGTGELMSRVAAVHLPFQVLGDFLLSGGRSRDEYNRQASREAVRGQPLCLTDLSTQSCTCMEVVHGLGEVRMLQSCPGARVLLAGIKTEVQITSKQLDVYDIGMQQHLVTMANPQGASLDKLHPSPDLSKLAHTEGGLQVTDAVTGQVLFDVLRIPEVSDGSHSGSQRLTWQCAWSPNSQWLAVCKTYRQHEWFEQYDNVVWLVSTASWGWHSFEVGNVYYPQIRRVEWGSDGRTIVLQLFERWDGCTWYCDAGQLLTF